MDGWSRDQDRRPPNSSGRRDGWSERASNESRWFGFWLEETKRVGMNRKGRLGEFWRVLVWNDQMQRKQKLSTHPNLPRLLTFCELCEMRKQGIIESWPKECSCAFGQPIDVDLKWFWIDLIQIDSLGSRKRRIGMKRGMKSIAKAQEKRQRNWPVASSF